MVIIQNVVLHSGEGDQDVLIVSNLFVRFHFPKFAFLFKSLNFFLNHFSAT